MVIPKEPCASSSESESRMSAPDTIDRLRYPCPLFAGQPRDFGVTGLQRIQDTHFCNGFLMRIKKEM